MSTTRFWGEPDDGVKVRRARGDPSIKWVYIFWGEIEVNGWPDNIFESYHIVRIRISYEYRISN